MKLIIPMGGKATRLYPHTLTTPKALLSLLGKPIVEHVVQSMQAVSPLPITDIGFIVNEHIDDSTKERLHIIAKSIDAKATIFTQTQPEGTAHAIHCAAPLLMGNVIIAFVDTLFQQHQSLQIDIEQEATIWTAKVADPSSYGVVKLDSHGYVADLIEKPDPFVTDLAIMGIYYFREGKQIAQAVQYILDENLRFRGEYPFTHALKYLLQKGMKFSTQLIDKWLDCGNKTALMDAHRHLLDSLSPKVQVATNAQITDSVLIPPVYIEEDAIIKRSIIGPYVSIGPHANLQDANLSNSIIGTSVTIQQAQLKHTFLGNQVDIKGEIIRADLGDFSSFSSANNDSN